MVDVCKNVLLGSDSRLLYCVVMRLYGCGCTDVAARCSCTGVDVKDLYLVVVICENPCYHTGRLAAEDNCIRHTHKRYVNLYIDHYCIMIKLHTCSITHI